MSELTLTRNLENSDSEQLLQLSFQPKESRNSREPIVSNSGLLRKESLNKALETSPDEYSLRHLQRIVSRLVESHHIQLRLVDEQKRKILYRQKIRKQKSEESKKNQHQPEQFHFIRRKSDYILDLQKISRRPNGSLTTSDNETCSSLAESTEIEQCFPSDRKDSLTSLKSMKTDAVNNGNNTQEAPPQKNLPSVGDSWSSCSSDISDSDYYVNDSELEVLPNGYRHITVGEICVIIPAKNLSGHLLSEFSFEVIEDISFHPELSACQVLVSKVIEIKPHGAKFHEDDPAVISLPYDIILGRNDHVICLCSDTGVGLQTRWKRIDSEDYNVFASHVEIKAYHFSLFAVVVTKIYPEARKTIRPGVGGCLYVPEVPGVKVVFPPSTKLPDIEASVKVLYADESYDVDQSDPEALALATPVVQLEPHGCVFNLDSTDFVTVHLPLLNGKEIQERFGLDRHLTFWCSSTTEDEDLEWQQFQPKFAHTDNDGNSLSTVYFSVDHFSFYTVAWAAWDMLAAGAHNIKLRVFNLIPVFHFKVSFKAFMSETSGPGGRFGICVACCIVPDKPLDDLDQEPIIGSCLDKFPILVGKSITPRTLSTGKLQIRLESAHFKADTLIGAKNLIAVENFTGQPFEIQFGCQFTGEAPDHGNFGSVIIKKPSNDGGDGGNNAVVSFLLNKPCKTDAVDGSLDWEVQLTKELTGLLSIKAEKDMGDDVWHEVAASLGYTRYEINTMNSSDNPMAAVITDYKRRGGKPHQFILALYKTGSPGNMTKQHKSNDSGSARGMEKERTEMEHRMCPCVKKNARKRRLKEHVNWEEKFQDIARDVTGNGKWKQLGRVLDIGENKIQEIEHDCSIRQDGLLEKVYQVLLAWRDIHPDQLTLDNLSSALCKIRLDYVARKHCFAFETCH